MVRTNNRTLDLAICSGDDLIGRDCRVMGTEAKLYYYIKREWRVSKCRLWAYKTHLNNLLWRTAEKKGQ